MPVDNLNDTVQTIGQYDLLDKIAEGGMGTVYRGKHRLTGEIVAVKVVPPHLLSNPVVLKRFEQEYNVARQIDHPNIVKALDFGREDETRYLVMEFVNGETLGQKIEREGRMNEEDAIHIISQIAEGLQMAHKKGMIHRDVKPDNILLTTDGVAKLTDLGLVKELETDLNLTRTGRGLGTPHFMAPEQFRNAKKADARCDIYSLGATLYMMVTGQLPFQSNGPLDAWMKKINNEIEPPRKFTPNLSERMDWAIRRAISPDPLSRPESCREFIDDLTGHSTTKLTSTLPTIDGASEYWYLVYSDDLGIVHTAKGTIKSIRRSLRDGMLGNPADVRVARTKAGPFQPLESHPEFYDPPLECAIAPAPAAKSNSDARKQSIHDPVGVATPSSADDSAVLQTTSISLSACPMIVKPAKPTATPPPASGPRINLQASEPSIFSSDLWRLLPLAFIFLGIGVLATLVLPTVIRYIRFM
jgi:eukaryotic-like serine/threonine-protein kinase